MSLESLDHEHAGTITLEEYRRRLAADKDIRSPVVLHGPGSKWDRR